MFVNKNHPDLHTFSTGTVVVVLVVIVLASLYSTLPFEPKPTQTYPSPPTRPCYCPRRYCDIHLCNTLWAASSNDTMFEVAHGFANMNET